MHLLKNCKGSKRKDVKNVKYLFDFANLLRITVSS